MLAREELERLFDGRPGAPRDRGTVDLLVVRTAPGEHLTPLVGRLHPDKGLVGDRWASASPSERDVDRQLTLMMTTVAELVCHGQPQHLPGDNLLVNLDLSSEALGVGARLRAGTAILEISPKPHTGCKKFVARFGLDAMEWVNDESGRARRLRGVNCRIVEPGDVRVGDAIEVISR